MTDLDPDSLALLNLAREARTPNDDDKARVGHRLALVLGASAAATATSAASSSVVSAAHAEANATLVKAGGAGIAKWIGGSALLAATVAGYVALSAPAAHVKTPRVAPQPVPAAVAPTPESPTALQAPVQADPAAAAPVIEAVPHRVARKHHAAQGDSLAAELELLHRAQAAWRARDAAGALSLLREHQSRYPHSQLDIERDALNALALCELGRADEAARIARNVIARAPHSPLRASLEQSCALK